MTESLKFKVLLHMIWDNNRCWKITMSW